MITISSLIFYLIPLAVVLLVLKLIALPIKIILRVLINAILGGLILFALSFFGIITVSLTWWMAAMVGILGVPGAIIVAVLCFIGI